MNMPFDPERDEVERRLRESLARRAQQAPEGDMLAEQIIRDAGRADATNRQPARHVRWGAPLAAAAVLILLAGVVLAVSQFRGSSTKVADSSAATVSRPPSTTAAPTPSPTPAPTRSTGSRTSTGRIVPELQLTGVHVVDLTFSGTDSGWALATADCLDGSGRTCPALLHSSDGTSWQPRGNFSFNVPGITGGCATACVTHIRFADDDTGYAFGPEAFFLTTDGGLTWRSRPGGAIALETLNQNVVRLTSTRATGCPGPCGVQVQTSAIGSTTWTTRTLGLPATARISDVSLSRGGSDVYVLAALNPAGGGVSANSTLYRSTDNGMSWSSAGEPCAQVGGEVDSSAVAAGLDGRVSVLCRLHGTPDEQVAVSTDHGASFRTATGLVPTATAGLLAGDPDVVLLTGRSGLARSADGGRTWKTVGDVTGAVSFVGFESATVGRAVTGGDTIWTTHDGGRSWAPKQFR